MEWDILPQHESGKLQMYLYEKNSVKVADYSSSYMFETKALFQNMEINGSHNRWITYSCKKSKQYAHHQNEKPISSIQIPICSNI